MHPEPASYPALLCRRGPGSALTSELQGRILHPLLQAFHGLHHLLVELLYDLVQQAGVLEPSPEGKRVVWEERGGSESSPAPATVGSNQGRS